MTGTGPRFLTLDEVADELATSRAQVYALVRTGDLSAIKLGGRGQWRVERTALEDYITLMYAQTEAFLTAHPFTDGSSAARDQTGLPRGATETQEEAL